MGDGGEGGVLLAPIFCQLVTPQAAFDRYIDAEVTKGSQEGTSVHGV